MFPPAPVFEQIISKPRLDSYRGYWKVSPASAVGLYMWNGEVCAEVSKLLSYFEISLRNNIHREMSLHTSSAAGTGPSASSHWWDTLWVQLKPVTKKKIIEVRQAAGSTVTLSPDEIVSRLSFGFWPNVLSWIAKQRTPLLPRILPAHPLSQAGATPDWWDTNARQAAISEVFELKDIRNRLAHHEPLWKFADVMDTSPPAPAPPLLIAAASTDEASTLARFSRLLQLYDRAIHGLSPQLSGYISTSSWRAKLDFLLTPRGLERYKNGCHIPETATISTLALRQQFAAVVRDNRPVRLLDHGGEGIFIPGK